MLYLTDDPVLQFTLDIPVGINHLYKSGKNGWYKDKKAVEWQEEAMWTIKTQAKKQAIKPEGTRVNVRWFRKDKRRYDIDGGLKLLLDTLVKAEVLEDDSQITHLTVTKEKSTNRNYCEVFVS